MALSDDQRERGEREGEREVGREAEKQRESTQKRVNDARQTRGKRARNTAEGEGGTRRKSLFQKQGRGERQANRQRKATWSSPCIIPQDSPVLGLTETEAGGPSTNSFCLFS